MDTQARSNRDFPEDRRGPVLTAACRFLATQLGLEFDRSIEVTADTGGDIRITRTKIRLSPDYVTAQVPPSEPSALLAFARTIINRSATFDQRAFSAHRDYVAEVKTRLARDLSTLRRLEGDPSVMRFCASVVNGPLFLRNGRPSQ